MHGRMETSEVNNTIIYNDNICPRLFTISENNLYLEILGVKLGL